MLLKGGWALPDIRGELSMNRLCRAGLVPELGLAEIERCELEPCSLCVRSASECRRNLKEMPGVLQWPGLWKDCGREGAVLSTPFLLGAGNCIASEGMLVSGYQKG